MSTLEDKLTASLKRRPAAAGKPATGKPATGKPTTGKPASRGQVKSERRADDQAGLATANGKAPAPVKPVAVERPLHPRRVWPD